MINDSLIGLFENSIKDVCDYKVNKLKDGTVEIAFANLKIDWCLLKERAENFWFPYNLTCDFSDKFSTVTIKDTESNLHYTLIDNQKKIPKKAKYVKTVLIFSFVFLSLSLISGVLIGEFSTPKLNFEDKIFISFMIFLLFGMVLFPMITIFYLNKNYRTNLLNMVFNSVLIDVLLMVTIIHVNNTKIYLSSNISNTILNIVLMLFYAIMISIILSFSSYLIRRKVLEKNFYLKEYYFFKNKIIKSKKYIYEKYCRDKKINITDVFLTKDGTNDIFGNLKMDFSEFKNNTLYLQLLFAGVTFLVLFYVNGVLENLSILSKVLFLIFIITRVTISTLQSIKKDKLILINAIFHLEKIYNLE